MRPVAVVLELILRQPPSLHLRLHLLRHARVSCDEIEPALLISLMLADDLAPPLVGRLGIVVVKADVVRAERAVVVRVRLVIRDRVEFPKRLPPAGREDAQEQLVLLRVVSVRLRKRHAIRLMVRQAHAEAVGLHALVAFAELPRRLCADAREHAALRITRNDVGADAHLSKVMPVVQDARLHAVPFLAVEAVRLAPDVVRHARGSHQVALVGRIDEHFPRVLLPAQRRDRRNPRAFLLHALPAVQPLVAHHRDAKFLHVILEHFLRRVRLENPHRPLLAIDRRRPLPLAAVLGLFLPLPHRLRVVVLPDAVVKVARQPADHRLVSRIGETEAPARQPAEMLVRADDHDRLSHLLRLHRGDHRGGRAPVDDDVVVRGRTGPGDENREQKDECVFHGGSAVLRGAG